MEKKMRKRQPFAHPARFWELTPIHRRPSEQLFNNTLAVADIAEHLCFIK